MGRKNEVLIYDNTGESWKHVKWKKPDTTGHTRLHIYEALQQVDLWRQRIEWGGGIASNCLMDTEFLFGLMTRKWIMVMVANTEYTSVQFSQFSRSVVSDSLQPHESQHARPPCPSPTPEFTQTHVHRVSDAIQLFHPLSSPFSPAPNPSQHQSLSQWVNSSHEVAKVLEFQL